MNAKDHAIAAAREIRVAMGALRRASQHMDEVDGCPYATTCPVCGPLQTSHESLRWALVNLEDSTKAGRR